MGRTGHQKRLGIHPHLWGSMMEIQEPLLEPWFRWEDRRERERKWRRKRGRRREGRDPKTPRVGGRMKVRLQRLEGSEQRERKVCKGRKEDVGGGVVGYERARRQANHEEFFKINQRITKGGRENIQPTKFPASELKGPGALGTPSPGSRVRRRKITPSLEPA